MTTSFPARGPAGDHDPSGHFVAAEANELEREGAEVIVVRPEPGGAFGWPGAAVRLRQRPWRVLEAGRWTASAALRLRELCPERIVAHWALPSAWPIAIAARLEPELDVVSHGGDVRLLERLPAPARLRIIEAIARRASRWRFVSQPLLDALLGACDAPRAAAVERVALVSPGTLHMLDVRKEAAARRSEFDGRRLYVCAGRLVATKRVDRIIDYVARPDRHASADRVLVVLGDGPERARLEHVARRWGIDVRFLGTRPRCDTLAWLGAADEIVHASEAEGLSTVLREAEHLGVPVTVLR